MGLVIRFAIVLLLTMLHPAQDRTSPYDISYRLAMSQPASHLFEVAIEVQVPPTEAADYIDFQIPLWQPGRYSVADFAKNVQDFTARSGNTQLSWTRVDDQTWRVQRGMNRTLVVAYRMFGNDLSGTYAQLDVGHANFTGGELFMYVVGHKADPVQLRIEPPLNWNVINGRTERPDQTEWRYPNYEILIDNPTEIGPNWTADEFKVQGKTYRVVVHSRGPEGGRRPSLVQDIQKIVEVETTMWGPPEFDSYTFLIHFAADDRSGDGMEHLMSTQIIEPGILAERGSYDGAVRTAAHEFFHVWNVKRLRPVELGPWDWTKPAATRALWIAEGFTQYYGVMLYHRAGFQNAAGLYDSLGNTIGAIENSPASRVMSAEDSSIAAPFIDGALHRQQTNLPNTSLSYYLKGELIALNLDLIIRQKTGGRFSLDDVMRKAYDKFYLKSPNATYYLKGRGYTIEEFADVVSEVAGADMTDFFARYVHGTETLPYAEALRGLGLRLVKSPASQPYTAGIVLDPQDRQGTLLGALRTGSPAERGGMQQGDVLLEIGGNPVGRATWRSILNRFKQGDRVSVSVRRFRETVNLSIQLDEPELFVYRIEEDPAASEQSKALRAAWLN
jgi:predicted metalloprotease with PDZ domain